MNKTNARAVVIGAGVAGMATAIRLAIQGFSVTVFEKNNYPGGKLSSFRLDDFHFDAGPSLFTQPLNIEELFALANEPIADYLQYDLVPVACRYFYEDGNIINAYSDVAQFANELQQKLGEDPEKVKTYLAQSENTYNRIGKIFLNNSLHKIKLLFRAPIAAALAATKSKFIFKTLHQLNEQHFSKPATVQLFDRFATYNGSNPYKAPGMLSLIPHLEQNEGTYYPKGGMISITKALFKLAEKVGVTFCFEKNVERIIQHEQKVYGIVVDQKNVLADIVISNMDAYFTYKYLLSNEIKAKKILRQERSSSALIFYWGMNKSFKELHLHNIFFSDHYQQEFKHLFESKTLSNDPTVYVNVTSKMEDIHAPAGKENWFVMINAPANTGQNWTLLKEIARTQIIKKLSRILKQDVSQFIEIEETLDPIKIESETSSYMGSLYGTSSNSKFAAFLRHPNFSSSIERLYFAGGSVHPGGGIPLCLKSAAIVSSLVQNDRRKYSHP